MPSSSARRFFFRTRAASDEEAPAAGTVDVFVITESYSATLLPSVDEIVGMAEGDDVLIPSATFFMMRWKSADRRAAGA